MTRHISIDLETAGIGHDAMILSIGAVEFDPATGTLVTHPEDSEGAGSPVGFYRVVDVNDPVGGGVIDASTFTWWLDPDRAAARDAIFGEASKPNRVNLRVALAELSEFLGYNESVPDGEFPDVVMWQRGDKDATWLETGYKGMQLSVPFAYWQWCDQRTFTKYFKEFLPERGPLVAHDAYDDAIYQALCAGAVFKRLSALGHVCEPAKPTVMPTQDQLAEALPTASKAGLTVLTHQEWEDALRPDSSQDHPNLAHP